MMLISYPCEQTLTRVGGPNSAWLLIGIQRQRIRAELLLPEDFIELRFDRFALITQFAGALAHSQRLRHLSRAALCLINISLNFAQRDRRRGQSSISMEYRVV